MADTPWSNGAMDASPSRPAPPSVDTTASPAGLRAIAVFEAVKGGLVLLVGVGLLSLLHRDVGAMVAQLVRRLHMNPARHYPFISLEAAAKVTDAKLWALAGGATVYATVRFVEAYGLWQKRVWAEWFALLSTSLYLPIELYELMERAPSAPPSCCSSIPSLFSISSTAG